MPIAANIYYYEYVRESISLYPAIVLLHGAGGTQLHWPPGLRRLPGFRVYSLDLPGHGKSPGKVRQSIDAYVEDLINWMQVVGLSRAVFIGHSMGSAIALTLSLNFPEFVVGLGLLGSGASLKVNPELLDITSSPTTFNTAVALISRLSFSPRTSDRLVELAANRLLETRPSVLHGDFIACSAFDESNRVSNIKQPSIIICGSDDRMTPPRFSKKLSNKIQNSILKIIPDAGHMVMLEQPQQVEFLIATFLNDLEVR